MKRNVMALLVAVLVCGSSGTASAVADAEAVHFTAPPRVTRTAEAVTIAFTVSAPTDVEVAVLDAKGGIVRHLAAGQLGENAPEPFKKGSLEQGIAWDGNDDLGRAASGGPFKASVRLGVKPELERYLGWNGRTLSSPISGLTVDKAGTLYVLLTDTNGRTEVRVFDRAGAYLRTIMPYPAGTPKARTAPIGQLEIAGERLPIVFIVHGQNLHPLTSGIKKQHLILSPKGHLLMGSAVGTWANHGPPRHLLALHTEGGAPEGVGFVGPQLVKPRGFMGGAGERAALALDSVATSPDGEWIYVTTTIASGSFKKYRQHAVFRVKWTDKTLGEPFLGAKEPGDGDAHFNDPQGIATDAKGNLYVCDRGNNRVMIFSPGRKHLGEFTVEHPQQIAIHPKTGEMYILSRKAGRSYKHPGTALIKFSPWGKEAPRELARIGRGGLVIEVFALDASASPTRLWAGLYSGWRKADRLVPIVDKGSEFEIGNPLNDPNGLAYPMFVSVDPPRQRLFVSNHRERIDRIDLKTGAIETGVARANEIVVDRDGNLYTTKGWTLVLERTDPEGKPLPWPATGSHKLGPWSLGKTKEGKDLLARSKGPNVGDRGHVVAPNGDLYIIKMSQYGVGHLDVYGPDGALKRERLIENIPHGSSGLAVDRQGNIYIASNLKPQDKPYPESFLGKVPTTTWVYWRRVKREPPWVYPYYNAYLYHWGAVFKFSPEGGRFYQWNEDKRRPIPKPDVPSTAVTYRTGYLNWFTAVDGAVWRRPGVGPVPTTGLNWGDPSCTCWNMRLAVDGFGRVLAPNVFRFSVEMLDANGNHIARIGRYGNADDGVSRQASGIVGRLSGLADLMARGGREEEPAERIAFAWPAFVAAGGGKVYVSDSVNRRVAVVRFTHTATADAAVPR